jgi:hypothetical protein
MGTVRDLGHVHVVSRQPPTLPAETEADGEDGHGEQPESSRARTRNRRSDRTTGVGAAARSGSDPGVMHRRQHFHSVNGSVETVLYVVPLLEG